MGFKSWLNKLVDPHSYSIPLVVAVLVHALVIGLLAIEWPTEKRQVAEPKPRNIQAKVIQTENKQVLKRQQEAKKRAEQRRKDAWRKKQLAKKKATEKKAAAKKKARQEALAKQKQLEQKRLAKEEKKKALAKKQAQEKREQEKQKRAEEKRAQALKEQRAFEQAQQAALLESLAQEEQQRSMEKALAEEQQAQKNAAITDSIIGQIQAKIYQTWRYPPSARPNMTVLVSIQLVPTGEVINVAITKGSGIEAIDRSVLAAVRRASPLPVPKDIRLFEQKFRSFSMEFSPKDAVW